MLKNFRFIPTLLISFVFSIAFFSCLKGDFDAPPSGFPEIPQEKIVSLNEVMALIQSGATKIDLDKYLEVVVVGDDRSGNFYKNMIVEDLNGDLGISIIIDETDLFSKYPVGQGVFVYLKELYIGLTEGLPTIGSAPDAASNGRVARIPAGLLNSIFFRGMSNIEVVPRKVTFSQLSPALYNTLIELENFEFRTATPGTTYADNNPDNPLSVNHTISNCEGNELVLRNSGFAEFAGQVVPSGNGSVVAVYSYFRNAAQLFIRETTDLNFTGPRCNEQSSGSRVTVTELRNLFKSGTTAPPAGFVQGVVISDASANNLVAQNLVLQDGDSGIVLRFSGAHNVPIGKEIKVILSGGTMSEFNGLLQVATISNSNITIVGDGVMPVAKELSISQIDLNIHESTLVKIKDVELSGGTTFGSAGGNISAKDATGTMTLFTRSQASFAGQALPTGKVTLTVIVSEFNTPQLQLRNASDIVGGGGPVDPPPTGGINENFNTLTDNQDIVLPGWLNIAVIGTSKWVKKSFSGDGFAEARSFQDSNPQRESWLITPEVNAVAYTTLSFDSEMAFYVHDGLTVWATSDYTGNPATTTWVKLNPKLAGSANANYERVASGNVDIKSFGAKARVGFKYVGTSATNTTTFRIDNVLIK
ncbi:MAG: choice-of-anchor J domain-containing protein [Saprospiraceae bacterium]|nr:choice-of-anchor J domain-containing protein [Saprospiraceae bacterium]